MWKKILFAAISDFKETFLIHYSTGEKQFAGWMMKKKALCLAAILREGIKGKSLELFNQGKWELYAEISQPKGVLCCSSDPEKGKGIAGWHFARWEEGDLVEIRAKERRGNLWQLRSRERSLELQISRVKEALAAELPLQIQVLVERLDAFDPEEKESAVPIDGEEHLREKLVEGMDPENYAAIDWRKIPLPGCCSFQKETFTTRFSLGPVDKNSVGDL